MPNTQNYFLEFYIHNSYLQKVAYLSNILNLAFTQLTMFHNPSKPSTNIPYQIDLKQLKRKKYIFQSRKQLYNHWCPFVCLSVQNQNLQSQLPSSSFIRHLQASSSITKHHQTSSNIINRYQLSSSVIKCHQTSSSVIKCHQASSSITKRHQASLSVIKHKKASSSLFSMFYFRDF